MRILISNISFYPAQEGGPTNALYWLASGLSHVGYDVCVVTTGKGISEENFSFDVWQKVNGFNVIYVKKRKWKKILNEELLKCNAYIACGVCTLFGFYTRLKAIKKGKSVIISPRGELFDTAINHKGKMYGVLKRIFFQIMRCCFSDKVIYHATSVEEEEVIVKLMKTKKVFNIPNLMILPEKVKSNNDAQPYLLYVGRINPIKALDKLLKAMALSKSFMTSNYTLKIAGAKTGGYYIELLKLIDDLGLNNKIEFMGVVSGIKLSTLYANAKWLFLVSDSENFGNVVIESLCQSTPVVASKGTPWQILNDSQAGFWVDNRPSSLSEIVDKIIKMPPQVYEETRAKAYKLSRKYDIYSNMGKWEQVLNWGN